MSKYFSRSRPILGLVAILMLCLSPAALADDGFEPFSIFNIVQELTEDLGEWLDGMLEGTESLEDGGEDEDPLPESNPNIDPVG